MNGRFLLQDNNLQLVNGIEWDHVVAVTGALGSGKTELAISLALSMAYSGVNIILADMDIINPYFCLRSVEHQIEHSNISILNPPGNMKWGDLSYINPVIRTKIYEKSSRLLLDVGGDSQGALALKQFEPEIKEVGYNLIFVINPYRTHTRTLKELAEMRDKLEDIGGLRVTCVAANPHFMDKTTSKECADGIMLVKKFTDKMGLPLLMGIAEKSISMEVKKLLPDDVPLWVLEREILLPWETHNIHI